MSLLPLLRRARLAASTVRHLRPAQVAYWPLRRLQHRLPPPAPPREAGALGTAAPAIARAVAGWGPPDPAACLARADAVRDGRFEFIGHEERLPRIDWSRRHVSHLWSYNLHYFDYAVDLAWAVRLRDDAGDAARLAELLAGWMDGVPYGVGDGWEPYALSVRAVNWSHALLLAGPSLPDGLVARAWRSVYAQLAFLERRVELHLLANHYQRNLRALHLGGLLFAGPRAARWRRRGAALWRELFEQVLPDGTHYERAPMYHASALADYLESLDVARAAGAPPPDESRVVERLSAMRDALDRLSRPDGSLHLFNDSADGIAPPAPRIARLAERALGAAAAPAGGAWALPDGGYFGFADDAAGERFVIDCGAVGPAYQPGHAHCDLLSFELDLAGRRVVVDAGVSGYDGDPLREYVRGTRAHNTVSVAGREQSEMWGTFRVARRAEPLGATLTPGAPFAFAGAYRPFWSGRAAHRRSVTRLADASGATWRVEDRLEGEAAGLPAVSFLHLHPALEVVAAAPDRVVARWADGAGVVIEPFGVAAVRVARGERDPAQGWHCPRFGVAIAAAVLELAVPAGASAASGYSIRYVSEAT